AGAERFGRGAVVRAARAPHRHRRRGQAPAGHAARRVPGLPGLARGPRGAAGRRVGEPGPRVPVGGAAVVQRGPADSPAVDRFGGSHAAALVPAVPAHGAGAAVHGPAGGGPADRPLRWRAVRRARGPAGRAVAAVLAAGGGAGPGLVRLRPLHPHGAGAAARVEHGSGHGLRHRVPADQSFDGVRGFDRPRRFDLVPPTFSTALYVDDQLTRPIGARGQLQVQAGLRLDALQPDGHPFSGPRDVAVQPRVNVEYAPVPRLRLRAGWGRTAKQPTLEQLFPAPQYFDIVNVNYFATDPA